MSALKGSRSAAQAAQGSHQPRRDLKAVQCGAEGGGAVVDLVVLC